MTSRSDAMGMMTAAVFVEPGRIVRGGKRMPDVGRRGPVVLKVAIAP